MQRHISFRALITLLALCTTGAAAHGTSPMRNWAFECKFEAVQHEKRGGLATIRVDYSPRWEGISAVVLTIAGSNKVQFPGEVTWQREVAKAAKYSQEFQVVIPDNDSSYIWMTFAFNGRTESHSYFFVTTSDTVEFWRGSPRGVAPKDPPWGWNKRGFLNDKEFPDTGKRYGCPVVEVVSLPQPSGTANLRVTFAPEEKSCDSIRIVCVGTNRLKTIGDSEWVAPVDMSHPYSREFQISIPPKDTSSLFVTIYCAEWFSQTRHFFVNTQDTLEHYLGNPWGHEPFRSDMKVKIGGFSGDTTEHRKSAE